jgi:hypothetical protein
VAARFLTWLAALGLVTLLLAVAGWLLHERAARGRGLPAYSVWSQENDGLGEAAHVLRQLGWRTVALTRPVGYARQHGLLVIVEPGGDAPSELEARDLLRWVKQGNTLLLASTTETPLHHILKAALRPSRVEDEPIEIAPLRSGGWPDDYTDDVKHLALSTRATIEAPGGRTLWKVGARPGAVVLRHGRGRILLLADPSVLTRAGLGRQDNVLLLVNVASLHARGDTVFVDEYHHGFRSAEGFWGYLGHYGQHLVLVPVLLAVGALVWRWSVRLGPARPRPVPQAADAVAYASSLARIYERAGAHRRLARVLAGHFIAALTRHLRLRPNALPAEILAAYRRRSTPVGEAGVQRLQALLKGLAELRRGEVTDSQLLAQAQALDRFRAELL